MLEILHGGGSLMKHDRNWIRSTRVEIDHYPTSDIA